MVSPNNIYGWTTELGPTPAVANFVWWSSSWFHVPYQVGVSTAVQIGDAQFNASARATCPR
jgi:hypothetical protein